MSKLNHPGFARSRIKCNLASVRFLLPRFYLFMVKVTHSVISSGGVWMETSLKGQHIRVALSQAKSIALLHVYFQSKVLSLQ